MWPACKTFFIDLFLQKNYKMSSKPRGRAIIINNSYFVNNSPRDGAAFDSQNICTHLEQLYFDVKLYADLTAMVRVEFMHSNSFVSS